jgi:hypothetical protein
MDGVQTKKTLPQSLAIFDVLARSKSEILHAERACRIVLISLSAGFWSLLSVSYWVSP